jgi:UDP-glucose 4-epimerase
VKHFAAFAYVGESVKRPILYYENNVGDSTAPFRAITETRTTLVVFSSTYGVPHQISFPEERPQRPVNPYGFSKLQILSELDFRLAFSSSRCFHVFRAFPV